jgi:hypothetical protein
MAHLPNGSFAKWYIRQITHKPYPLEILTSFSKFVFIL